MNVDLVSWCGLIFFGVFGFLFTLKIFNGKGGINITEVFIWLFSVIVTILSAGMLF
jgi:hypothetical protein